jgi:hypothetical protein
VGECLRDALEREARGDQAFDAELRHEGQRPPVGRAATDDAADLDLAAMQIPEVERERRGLRVHAHELQHTRPRA